MRKCILSCLLTSISIWRASCILVLDSNESTALKINSNTLSDLSDSFGTTLANQEEKSVKIDEYENAINSHVDSLETYKAKSSALSFQVLGKQPLCIEKSYLSCVNDAMNAFDICSAGNEACYCYYAGAAIVECSKFCSSFNLNSFYHFKTTCSDNPYVSNLNKEKYYQLKNQNLKVRSLINELNNYKNIQIKQNVDAKQVSNDFNYEKNSTIKNFLGPQEILFELFDNVKIIEPQWKPFERDDLEQYELSSEKIESKIQIERQNHETQKLNNGSDADNYNQKLVLTDNQALISDEKNSSNEIFKENDRFSNSSEKLNATGQLEVNHKIEDGSENSSGKVAATSQKSYILGTLVIILTSLLI